MKNLKRALSLVLSTAMVLGMMVVGTGAAFADVKADHNEEAIAVATAAGIFAGDDKGNFNPDAKITRNEMAVVMTNMLGLDTKDYAGASNFTDVPAWAADYVDACFANGIVSGVSATQYNGAANVTTAEAALMMLKALGYFEYKGINDWMLDTIKQASKINLLDGIDAKASAALTRNEVAQLVLNTLEANVVEEIPSGNNTSIKGDNFEITVDSAVQTDDELNAKTKDGKEIAYADKDGVLQLIEELFDADFTKDEKGTTKLGLPAVVWTDNEEKEVIVRAAKAADEVVIAEEKIDALKLYKDEIDEDFEGKVTDKDGKAVEAVAGDVVYYYENGDDFNAYVVTYELVKIEKIDDDMKKWEIEEGYSFQVELSNKDKVYDTDFVGFDYEEDDYVLVVMGTKTVDGEEYDVVHASELAEIVEGKIASKKSGKFYISGTGYENLDGETTLSVKDEITAVLNKAGQIIKVTEQNAAVKSDDFAYIYNVVENDGEANEDGIDGTGSYTAYVVLADGTKAKYTMAEEEDEKGNLIDLEAKYEKTVQAYSINKDDEFEVEASDLLVATVDTKLSNDNKSVSTTIDKVDYKVYANSKTEFVFASWKDNKLTATTATGIKNVDIDTTADKDAQLFVIFDKDDEEALYVFVEAKDEGVESDAEYAVLLDKPADYDLTIDEDDNEYYTYNVAINGEEETLVFEESLEGEVARGEIFAYIIDGDYAVVSKADNELKDAMVTYVGEGFIELTIDSEEYTIADDAELYVKTEVKNAKGETTGFEVSEADELEKDDVIKFVANKDSEITLAFIIEVDD